MNKRDRVILHKIVKYSAEIQDTIGRFNLNLEKFKADYLYVNSIAMDVLQFGELANKLTDDFRREQAEVPWHEIVAMRNRATHDYERFDVPVLREFCERTLAREETDRR